MKFLVLFLFILLLQMVFPGLGSFIDGIDIIKELGVIVEHPIFKLLSSIDAIWQITIVIIFVLLGKNLKKEEAIDKTNQTIIIDNSKKTYIYNEGMDRQRKDIFELANGTYLEESSEKTTDEKNKTKPPVKTSPEIQSGINNLPKANTIHSIRKIYAVAYNSKGKRYEILSKSKILDSEFIISYELQRIYDASVIEYLLIEDMKINSLGEPYVIELGEKPKDFQ